MANTTVGAQVQVEFSSVGQMRKAIKEATSDLIAMQEQFGKTSPQAIEAARRIADLKDRIQDAKEQADLFDPGKRFSAFTAAASKVAAGFSAVQGAMALVGNESEDLQKQLLKVQGAIALTQGLSELSDLGEAFDKVKVIAVSAFNSIKAAIGSTGIGLLVIALGTIVTYWDEIKSAVSGVSEEQKKLNAESEKNLKAEKEKLDAVSSQDEILKSQGKSEREILQIKIKQTDETIKAAEINLQNSIATTKAQVAAAARNKQILQGVLAFISLPLSTLLKSIDMIGQAFGQNFDLYNRFYGGIASFVFDPAAIQKEGDEAAKAQETALLELKNKRAGFQNAITDIDKQAAQKRLDDQDKANAERLKKQEEADKKAKERAEAMAKEQRDINELIQKELDEQFAKDEERRKQIEAEIKESEERQFKLQIEAAELRQKLREDELKRLEEIETEKQQLYADTGNALGVLGDLIGRETAAGKALAVAQATINTWLGVTEVLKQKSILPEPAATISKVVNVATIVASGINAVRNIVRTQVPRGGGGGGSVPSISGGGAAPVTAQPTPTVTAQTLNAQAINNLGNQGMRAYVLNSDITNNEQRNAYLQRNARLG